MADKFMNRKKLFFENFIIYGMGSVLGKIIPFIMLPILVRLYPSTEYIGYNDVVITMISLSSSIAIMGMYDAMFRFYFDEESYEYKKRVCSSAMLYVFIASLVLCSIIWVFRNYISLLLFGGYEYQVLVMCVVVGILTNTCNSILSAPTRMQNKRFVYLITNTITPILSYSAAFFFILKGNYLLAMPIAGIFSSLVLCIIFAILNRNWFGFKYCNTKLIKKMLAFGAPLFPNLFIFWLYNSADKMMITTLMGAGYTGIYSVASKFGQVSNLIDTAFSGGWLYFAYKTMNDDDQVQMKSRMFELLALFSFIITVLLMAFSRLIFAILFTQEYFQGYILAPYLFITPLLHMVYLVAANQFSIIKKSYMNTLTLATGAIINIILNYVLINLIGIEGAAIATFTGYIVSITLCTVLLVKHQLLSVSIRCLRTFLIFVIYFIIWRMYIHRHVAQGFVFGIVIILLLMYMYKNEMKLFFQYIFKLKQKKVGK